jgi:hypothetical protein
MKSANRAYNEISKCRISDSANLLKVLSLGEQHLTGVFPKSSDSSISKGPIDLVWCQDSGLLQLKQSYDLDEMYGENYGYRSGLNASMVRHLAHKANSLLREYPLENKDVVIDVGANDSTLLQQFKVEGIRRIGIDPTGLKFSKYYPEDIELIPEFYSTAKVWEYAPGIRAKLITSISMFYDLENPIQFVSEIAEILEDDGLWHFEQSYMPSMLRLNSYDTICHEHLEYYSLHVVKSILEKCDMKILDVEMNSVNGGSFAVTACKRKAPYPSNEVIINWILNQEIAMGLMTPAPYREFESRVFQHRLNLLNLIRGLREDGKKVFGYGASTKGNVMLQFCGFTKDDISFIAEVNEDKFGTYTPGTNIPIISEEEARKLNPDYFLILPWHFKHGIIEREKEYLSAGGKMICPMPEIEIIGG